jgi:hypothetical protein
LIDVLRENLSPFIADRWQGCGGRIEKEIDKRVDERVAKRVRRASALNPPTLGVCIPIIAIAGGIGGVPA